MKKKLLVLGLSLFLVGCSNKQKETTESSSATESSVVKKAPSDKLGFTSESLIDSNFNELINDDFKLVKSIELDSGAQVEVLSNQYSVVNLMIFTGSDESIPSAFSVSMEKNPNHHIAQLHSNIVEVLNNTIPEESSDYITKFDTNQNGREFTTIVFNDDFIQSDLEESFDKIIDQLPKKEIVKNEATKNTENNKSDKQPEVPREFNNAKKRAKEYLEVSSFSKEGLYDQLIFEEFPEEAARYGVDNIEVDWNSYAAKRAVDYLEISSFSDERLYEQLLHDKFTEEQARYAIDNLPN